MDLLGHSYETHDRFNVVLLDGRHNITVNRDVGLTYIDKWSLEALRIYYPEIENEIEGWSRSYYIPSTHMTSILSYNRSSNRDTFTPDNWRIYQQAVADIKDEFDRLPMVRALDPLSELDLVPFEPTASAGYNYVGKKGENDNQGIAIRRARALLHRLREQGQGGLDHEILESVPNVAFTRTQLSYIPEKHKVRNVWGQAFHYILLEGICASPLMDMFAKENSFFFVGQDPMTAVPALIYDIKRECEYLGTTDWSEFDASAQDYEIRTAFNLLQDKIIFPNDDARRAFAFTRELFIHKKLAAPNGRFYAIHTGVPSGSYYTMMIDSIINAIRICYLHRLQTNDRPKRLYTQGDDALFGTDYFINKETLESQADVHGWTLTAKKTEFTSNPEMVEFLQRRVSGGIAVREIPRLMKLAVLTEYPVTDPQISAFRMHSMAQDVGGHSLALSNAATYLASLYGMPEPSKIPRWIKRVIPGLLIPLVP